jgi:hypothetical protein
MLILQKTRPLQEVLFWYLLDNAKMSPMQGAIRMIFVCNQYRQIFIVNENYPEEEE